MGGVSSAAKPKRYAAGRARALGLATRGTTAPNRLRRVDRWLTSVHRGRLAGAHVVDLGYGATAVTTVELHARVTAVAPDARVTGLEIDRERVAAAQPATRPGLAFAHGGFELAGLRPDVVRALNVLRQYDEPQALEAWGTVLSSMAPDGLLVEGTCDELGRRASWVALVPDRGPLTLTLAAHLPSLERPSDLAERLPKALIHHNTPGHPVHDLLGELDSCWERAAAYQAYGSRQRWVEALRLLDRRQLTPDRARFGELTVPWEDVVP
jgi:hypothetical protein